MVLGSLNISFLPQCTCLELYKTETEILWQYRQNICLYIYCQRIRDTRWSKCVKNQVDQS